MNLKYSGLIFLLIVILDAITGSRISTTTVGSHIGDVTAAPEKSHAENAAAEAVKTIKPISSDVTSNLDKTTSATDTTTTTTKTTTSTTTTSTTTTTTTTTTTQAPPAPVPPSPAPAPERGTWVIRDEKRNKTCVIAQMAMQLNITYPGQTKPVENDILNVPKNATSNGSCSDPHQALTINWGPGHSLRINFSSNETTKNFFVSSLELSVNATVLKDAKVENNNSIWHFANSSSEFLTPLQMSYKCNKEQDLKLDGTAANQTVVLSVRDTQLEAYMNKTKSEFGAAQDCDSFDTPDIVPIAVGCALTILVLVVLAAYLIGRRRSQNRGYLSM